MDNVGVDREYFGPILSSSSLSHSSAATDSTKLRELALPVLGDEEELSAWLGIPLGRLRWFTHDRADETVWHYTRYAIPKRSGGLRVILAPKSELKQLQRKVLWELINNVQSRTISLSVHGFVPQRSIITNARHHVGKQVVLRMDLESFFPSIHLLRVRDLFESFGYPTPVASALALLCTKYDRETVIRDGAPHFLAHGPRHLVQGSPTSPALANLVARELDTQLEGLAVRFKLTYTRYADDLTFSGDRSRSLRISHTFLSSAQTIIREQGFKVNQRKTSFAHQSTRQLVTGIVVNEKASTPRTLRRRLRAILHNGEVEGLAAQNYDNHPEFEAYIRGQIAFVESANPDQAKPLLEAFKRARIASQRIRESPPLFYREDELGGGSPQYLPKIGDHVVHEMFGPGVVTAVTRDEAGEGAAANRYFVEVYFQRIGRKILAADKAHLRLNWV